MLELQKDSKKVCPAIVYAHPSNGLFLNAEFFLSEACHLAVSLGCIVFSVDYRKAPVYKVPTMHKDFALAINHVLENTTTNQIDKSKICVMG